MQLALDKILFLDIETAPLVEHHEELTPELKSEWSNKHRILRMEDGNEKESFESKAGIYAEFGKIVCIAVGFIHYVGSEQHFRLKAFAGKDEKQLLTDFFELLSKYPNNLLLCGHNIKEFDIPYICRRALINQLSLPIVLQVHGKKPWEVNFIDTLQLWKFGDYKNYTSLSLIAKVLGIPTPKDDIDGSMVGNVFYKEDDLERIVVYCQKDVITVAQVLLRMQSKALIDETYIEWV